MATAGARTARRADARHNVERILDAATASLGRDPGASMSEIAQAAGVGRVTLYAHFASREILVEATMQRLLAQGEEVLADVDLDGDPRTALRALIEASWLLTAQAGSVLVAAQAVLPPGRVHELHAEPERRVDRLIRRGQADGSFRDDLPVPWLASVLHHVIKGAAADVSAERLDAAEAPYLIAETMVAALEGRD